MNFSVYLNYSFVFFAFSLPVSRSGVSAGVLVSFLLWLLEGNWKTKLGKLGKDYVTISVFSFIGLSLLSLLWTEEFRKVPENIKDLVYFLYLPMIVTSLDKKFVMKIVMGFSAGMGIHMILSFLLYFQLLKIPGVRLNPYHNNPWIFMNHLDYSMFLAVFSVLMFFLIFKFRDQRKYSAICFFGFAVSVSLLFIVMGRTGQIGFLFALPVMLLRLIKSNAKWFMIVLPAVIFGVAFASSKNFRNRMEAGQKNISSALSGDYQSSIGQRLLGNRISWEIFKQHPLFGVGIGDNTAEFSKWINYTPFYRYMKTYSFTHLHNQYAQTGVQLGIAGLVLLINFFIQFLRKLHFNIELSALGLALVLIYLIGFVGEPYLRKQFPAALLAFSMAVLVALAELQNQENKSSASMNKVFPATGV